MSEIKCKEEIEYQDIAYILCSDGDFHLGAFKWKDKDRYHFILHDGQNVDRIVNDEWKAAYNAREFKQYLLKKC